MAISFFSAIGCLGFKWHILGDGSFARKQGRRRRRNPLSHVLLPDGTRGGVRERMEMKLSWIS